MWLPGKERPAPLRRAQGRQGSLNGILPGFAGPLPFTALALLPLALAPPAAGGHRFGKGFSLSRIVPFCAIGTHDAAANAP